MLAELRRLESWIKLAAAVITVTHLAVFGIKPTLDVLSGKKPDNK